MERAIVNANELNSVGYNSRKNDLELEFQDGNIILYLGVPAHIWVALMNAEDKDAYYTRNIKDIFIYRKV